MANADELRTKIEANRQALRDAIEASSAKWEQSPGGEEWSPRKIAEHAIGAERGFAGMVATAMQGNPPERQELALASSAEAITALESAAAAFTKVVRYVEDRDLPKSAPAIGDYAPSIEGALQLSADHLANHAEHIRKVSA
ncbi:MAG: DinB family protein [Chloroflexi bacterium]|nr:DinB family protein [Chloroflexota bacterium]MDA1002933.1 DinB family protein [Chloroflexota bacterium]